MALQVGIDLGTTNTVVAYFVNGKFEFLRFRGIESLSSCLLYQKGTITIGETARKKSILYPENYIKSSKAYMGGKDDKKWIIEDRIFTPTDVATEILKELYYNLAKKFSTEDVIEAVITVPAYFDSKQIEETKLACSNAGFITKRVITEPVAAAIAYGLDDNVNQTIAVIDVGGGTFDVSVLQIDNREYNTLFVEGDANLGGDDFDNHILNIMLSHIRRTEGINLASFESSGLSASEYFKAYQILLNKAEEIKIELSEATSVVVEIANLIPKFDLSMTITRDEFITESKVTIQKIEKIINSIIIQHPTDKIDKVVLVGGSSRIPIIREFVSNIFNKAPFSDKPLDKLVAQGAAIVGFDDNSIQINDIISHSLGIKLVGDKFSIIIPKNTRYPVSKSEIYTTVNDNQQRLDISVYEGEDEENVHNNFLYSGFVLSGIQIAAKGVPKIEVTFQFDINRVLKVTAKDLVTNAEQSENITIIKS